MDAGFYQRGLRLCEYTPMHDDTRITLTIPDHIDAAADRSVRENLRAAYDSEGVRRADRRAPANVDVMLSGDSLEVQSLTALFGDLIKMAASGFPFLRWRML